MSSVYVVCWVFLQTFQTYFCMQANSVDPDQTAPRGVVWSGSTLFAKNDFLNHKQMTKQTTIVMMGSLRVNYPPGETVWSLGEANWMKLRRRKNETKISHQLSYNI